MRTIYISGPISAPTPEQVDANLAAFYEAEDALREAGHDVRNPARNGLPKNAPWVQHMRADIRMMMDCDSVVLLPGWYRSKGVMVELTLAHGLGYTVFPGVPLAIMDSADHPAADTAATMALF